MSFLAYAPMTPTTAKHFSLPLSLVDLQTSVYDPTYGSSAGCITVARCDTCAAMVEEYGINHHAEWHERYVVSA